MYVINNLKYPITNAQLTEIILENNFINYFTLQQYISELITSKFLKYKKVNDKNLIYITNNGVNALTFFTDRITPLKKKIIDDYLLSMEDSIKKELTINGTYTLNNDGTYLVDLRALENENLLLSLKVTVPSKKQASSLTNKWNENPTDIYNSIMNLLFNDEN